MRLFEPISLRSVQLANRIVIAPMQQYMAGGDGLATDWHYEHYSKLASGGAGLVITGALAVCPEGRLTPADLGVWNDEQVSGLARICQIIAGNGAVPGAQIVHAGRKASVQRPWDGFGPLTEADIERHGMAPWPTVAPSAIPMDDNWPTPRALTRDEIRELLGQYAMAARRLDRAGYQVLNIHGAHGFLIHSFLSPHSNHRHDEYGGSLEARMRFALEVAEAVRSEWPAEKPIFYRLSCVDDVEGGWDMDDTVALAKRFRALGIDIVDCSSGGLKKRTTTTIVPRRPGYQVEFAARTRRDAEIATMAVGLIREPAHAESILADGAADLIAIGREALFNPHWPLQAAVALKGIDGFDHWPPAYGWWLKVRQRILDATPDSTPASGKAASRALSA